MKVAAMFAMAFALSLTLGPTLALADGGSSGTNADCPRGEVWDSRAQKCVKQQGSVLPDKVLTDYAYALAKAERYDEALATLDLLRNPNTAEALNYRGYATRKLEERLGEGTTCLFTQGGSGNINPLVSGVRKRLRSGSTRAASCCSRSSPSGTRLATQSWRRATRMWT